MRMCRILNPTKDNLILDPAGVEGALGVPPERVMDVMALRGDCDRQHSGRAGDWRQGIGGVDPAVWHGGGGAGPARMR